MRPDLAAWGAGGDTMRAAGAEVLYHVRDTAVVGLLEVLSRLRFFRKMRDELLATARRRGTRVALLVDFSGFNLRLARELRAMGVKVVWYVSPQVWAWRRYRARTLGAVAEKLLVVFPFEVDFYRHLGIEATFVGHPLAEVIRIPTTRAAFRAEIAVPEGALLVAVLPGSRGGEVARLLSPIRSALLEMGRDGGVRFAVARASAIPDTALAPIADVPGVTIVSGRTWEVLAHCDAAIVCSGTATVEAALCGAPMVVVYKLSPATFAVVRRVVKVPYAAMPNLLLGRLAVPELIQGRATGSEIASEVRSLLADEGKRAAIARDLAEVKRILGEGGAAQRAAREVAAVLDQSVGTIPG